MCSKNGFELSLLEQHPVRDLFAIVTPFQVVETLLADWQSQIIAELCAMVLN
jgi:hypothetical protein